MSCEECNASTFSLVRCVECDENMCMPCDGRIHAGGNRRSHVRMPVPTAAEVLSKKLGQRPDQSTLLQNNILKAPLEVSPVLQAKSAELQRKRLSDSLNNHMNHRLSPPKSAPVTTAAYMLPQIAAQARTEETMLAEADAIIADFNLEMSNLNRDFSRVCFGCMRDLVKTDKTIEALGRKFHVNCLVCEECRKPLHNEVYVEHAGKIYCEADHRRVFATPCKKCGGPVIGKMVQGLGGWYHPEHFCCSKCDCQLTETTHIVYQDQAFCRGCFASQVAPKCSSCLSPVLENRIEALGKSWCSSCFVCQVCRVPFKGQFYQKDGVPLCETHFHARNRSLCHTCTKPVVGECFQTLGRSYHPTCFQCVTCRVHLKGQFFEHAGEPYCETHVAEASARRVR